MKTRSKFLLDLYVFLSSPIHAAKSLQTILFFIFPPRAPHRPFTTRLFHNINFFSCPRLEVNFPSSLRAQTTESRQLLCEQLFQYLMAASKLYYASCEGARARGRGRSEGRGFRKSKCLSLRKVFKVKFWPPPLFRHFLAAGSRGWGGRGKISGGS